MVFEADPSGTKAPHRQSSHRRGTWSAGASWDWPEVAYDTMLRLCEEHGLCGVPTDFRIYACPSTGLDERSRLTTAPSRTTRSNNPSRGRVNSIPPPSWMTGSSCPRRTDRAVTSAGTSRSRTVMSRISKG